MKSQTKARSSSIPISITKSKPKLDTHLNPTFINLHPKSQSKLPNCDNRPIMKSTLRDFRCNNGIKTSSTTPTFMNITASTKFLKAP